jgi:hypothetical protein
VHYNSEKLINQGFSESFYGIEKAAHYDFRGFFTGLMMSKVMPNFVCADTFYL